MPKVEIPEERILEALNDLSPRGRREALRRLLPRAAYIERAVQRNGPRIKALARSRGLDWAALDDDQREQLIDELLHE